MAARKQNQRVFFRVFSTLLLLFMGSAAFPTPVRAFSVTITVTTSADNTTTDTFCSLREAITNANNNAATFPDCGAGSVLGEVINFTGTLGNATITLGSALPAISDATGSGLTITGGGMITVSGNNLYRVFTVNANALLTLNGLSVTHGLGAPSGGGAYVNPGSTLTILNSTFSNNSASTIGGAIDNFGTLVITNSTFANNSAVDSGGAVISSGTLTISGSSFNANSSGYGGALRSLGGAMTITTSTFSSNQASSWGGAIYNPVGTLAITLSTFSGNSAGAGGGISNLGLLTIGNSTFFNNSAVTGGGLSNSYVLPDVGSAYITNSTFSLNSATSGGGAGGGGVSNDALLTLTNTIIANSPLGGDCDSGGTTTGSHNLIEGATTSACDLANGVNGNLTGLDPNLGPGSGSPVYLPLNGGSPAINAGDDTACAAAPVNNTSQNGLSRPQGAHCDIGAYEADVTPPTVLSITRVDPNPTTAAAVHFTVTFSEPVYGVTLADFVLTAPGLTGATVSALSSDAGATRTVTVSTGSGTGTLRLDLTDRNTILDTANLYLGGPLLGDGSYAAGAAYLVRPYHVYLAAAQR